MSTQLSSEQLNRLKTAMARLKQSTEAPQEPAAQEMAVSTPAPETLTAVKSVEDMPKTEGALSEGTYVKVDEDEMAAWLYLVPPEEGMTYEKQELIDYLAEHGVVEGLHQSNLSGIIKKKVYNREILVAKGREVQEGADGYFEYLFTPEEYGVPKVRDDGSVDYTNVNALQNVKAGEKVAIYHHAVQSIDGCTVLGNSIQGKLYRDLPPMRGKGIRREEEVYYAQMDGKIELKDGRVDIQNVHEISGDVDMIIGKVEFFGDIIIYGNVEEGVTIRAGRNIEIHGTTSMANLYAGGDIVLSRGIQGGNRSKVSARGNVFADFIEHTTVEAGGLVQANIIMNSNVSAKDKVVATGKKGAIIGGYIHAVKGIEAVNAGNEVELKTVLHSGYEAQTRDLLRDVIKKEAEMKEKIAELVDGMTDALREKRMRGSSTSPETEKKLSEWNKLKNHYFVELDKQQNERKILEDLMEQSKGTQIVIDGNIYRGVVICINTEQMLINRSTCFMRYSADKGVIEGSVIIHD